MQIGCNQCVTRVLLLACSGNQRVTVASPECYCMQIGPPIWPYRTASRAVSLQGISALYGFLCIACPDAAEWPAAPDGATHAADK